MKRVLQCVALIVFVSFFNLATVLVLTGLGARSSQAGPPECVPGDINGDESVGLADAIYLLNFLFQDGDEPIACAVGPADDCCWPPAPEDLVYVTETLGVPAGGEALVYTVPPDRFLVLTDLLFLSSTDAQLVRRVGAVDTLITRGLSSEAGRYSSAVGIAIPPGSELILQNMHPNFAFTLNITLTGYLANPSP